MLKVEELIRFRVFSYQNYITVLWNMDKWELAWKKCLIEIMQQKSREGERL